MTLHTYTVKSQDIMEIKAVLRGPEYLSCLHDLYQEFRKLSKYNNDEKITWHDAYNLFWRIISENAVNPIEE